VLYVCPEPTFRVAACMMLARLENRMEREAFIVRMNKI
jgi:hypothetical protein